MQLPESLSENRLGFVHPAEMKPIVARSVNQTGLHWARLQMVFVTGFSWAATAAFACGACFYPTLHWRHRVRRPALLACCAATALSPFLVPPDQRLPRTLAAIIAVMVVVKLWDLHLAGTRRLAGRFLAFLLYLPNPLAIVPRKIESEAKPSLRCEWGRIAVGAPGTLAAALLLIIVWRVDWQSLPFLLEHSAKVIGFFLLVLVVGNTSASALRLAGLPATDAFGNVFAARTPAEFWRLYNRPAEQWFHHDVFKPLGGFRRPVLATLLTFAVSGIIHEYVFAMGIGRIRGWQLEFFMLQGVAVIATARLRPVGWAAAWGIALTLAFNLTSGVLFFRGVNGVLPFYAPR